VTRNFNPHKHNRDLMTALRPEMRFDGSLPFAEWQKAARDKLLGLLGLPFVKCDPLLEIESKTKTDDAKELRFTFQSEEGYFVPCHLLIPKGAAKPLPVVICLQGHSTGMHVSLGRARHDVDKKSDGDEAFAVRALREGYCALTIEQRCFGECGGTEKGPDCYNSSMAALLIGRTTLGERVWDVQRAIDVLEKHFPQADANSVVCMGNSGGGTAAFYAACVEERIKAAMPSCSVCAYEDSIAARTHCSCNFVPNVRKYFDMGDLGGLIAPRKLVVVTGKYDTGFFLDGVKKSYAIIKGMYDHIGRGNDCALVVGDGGHRFYADEAWPVLNGMLKRDLN